jgi:tetratricopeptide (TPR) repeat protein
MIAAVLPLMLAFQVTPELRQHVEAGMKARAAGDLDTAIREFKRVAELAPQMAAAHVNLGAAYFDKKSYGQAIPPLKRALQLNADLPGAEAMLGAALLAQGYAAESIAYLEKARMDDLLGVALLESGRPREALDRLEAALLKRPQDEDLLYYLSQAHGRLSKQAFDRLRAESPGSARVQQMLGEASAASGNRDAAEKQFRSALALRPDLRSVHLTLGEMYLEGGDYERAEVEFRAEAEMVPGSAAAAYKLGAVLLNRGRIREAIVELQRSNALLPDMPETLVELGKAMVTGDDAQGAAKWFERVLELEKTSRLAETAHFQLAQIYRKLGRTAEADREMKLFQQLRGARK